MLTTDFNFHLPEALIAQYPLKQRTASRLLHLCNSNIVDRQFTDLPDLLNPRDLLVFNNTKVIPARLSGQKSTGGKVEVLVERVLDENHILAHVRASKSPGAGVTMLLEQTVQATMLERDGDLFKLHLEGLNQSKDCNVLALLEKYGHMPLPPYIARADEAQDQQRYQTVYAKHAGAVAAPTAGLHFDQQMLDGLKRRGFQSAFVTLHVGAGTFQPVRVENIEDHHMHSEYIDVELSVVNQIKKTKAEGGRVIAVGTTAVRSLESAAMKSALSEFHGESRIFIYPGYEFQVVDAMVTNFHLPQSTLLMLVSAFSGADIIKQAYEHAVCQQYRFFSYGDAMFLEKSPVVRP